MPLFKLDLDTESKAQVDELVRERADPTKKRVPQFTTRDKLQAPKAYKRFQNEAKKIAYREKLVKALYEGWKAQFPEETALALKEQYIALAQSVDDRGAMIIADLIDRSDFSKLVSSYDTLLKEHGNDSLLHSYVNLANHPSFLGNTDFDKAFMHPLLISLVSYQVGGSVRLVDGRAKDAKPMSVKAQDNMLHIDNTPFNDEYKVILTWEKSKASGPKGQNFVFIPGTHKGVRDCLRDERGRAVSSEDGSIFITPEAVDQIFSIQETVTGRPQKEVVEVSHPDKPLTTVFAAGSLVHHRYRTTEKQHDRSCMIIALHRAGDNPGQFMSADCVRDHFGDDPLKALLFGRHTEAQEDDFIAAIAQKSKALSDVMSAISSPSHSTEILSQQDRVLEDGEAFDKWKHVVTAAPTIEDKKTAELVGFKVGEERDVSDFFDFLGNHLMMYDKHGPLDLALYDDAHEEIRKWARNRIREIKQPDLVERLAGWEARFDGVNVSQLLTPAALASKAQDLVSFIDSLDKQEHLAKLPTIETIASEDAYRSIRQLIADLGEAIERCDSRQAFLSTSLFLFWAVDELQSMVGEENATLQEIGQALLSNYISTAVLIEKQIRSEKVATIEVVHEKERDKPASPARLVSQHSPFFKPLDKAPAQTEEVLDDKDLKDVDGQSATPH
jgi:hypothetical protein